jgi:uncharacterized protein (DUF1810 family)
MAEDLYHLERFLVAQSGTYAQAHGELTQGRKRSHWMWFIFPQITGLGSSPMAQRFAISGLPEAEAYLAHAVLGPRLRDCTALVNQAHGTELETIFGYPDNLKFHSSVTVFDRAAPKGIFAEALQLWFNGKPDQATLRRL